MFEPSLDASPMDISSLSYSLRWLDDYIDMETSVIEDTHIHDCFEVYMNISGDVSFFVKNHIFPIGRGDIVFTRPNELHKCVYNASCVHEHFCLWFDMNSQNPMCKIFGDSDASLISLSSKRKEELIAKLYEFNGYEKAGKRFEATVCLLDFLMIIAEQSTVEMNVERNDVPEELQTILDYINLHYNELTNLNDLYNDFFVSAATLNRWFVKYLRMPPKTYLKNVKLSNAKRLLREGKSVTEVCFECGYSDCSHFISVFRNHFGQTPLQYKNPLY